MRTFLVLLILLATSVSAGGRECQPGSPEVTTLATGVSLSGDGPGIYYVDNDPCQPDCIISVWVYEETNGREGLQRGDQFGDCSEEADTIIL